MSRRPSTAYSPAKSPKKRNTVNVQQTTADYEAMMVEQQHQLSMQVSDKEIEIERLKTTVFALNSKVEVVTDIEKRLESVTMRFEDSEHQRASL